MTEKFMLPKQYIVYWYWMYKSCFYYNYFCPN